MWFSGSAANITHRLLGLSKQHICAGKRNGIDPWSGNGIDTWDCLLRSNLYYHRVPTIIWSQLQKPGNMQVGPGYILGRVCKVPAANDSAIIGCVVAKSTDMCDPPESSSLYQLLDGAYRAVLDDARKRSVPACAPEYMALVSQNASQSGERDTTLKNGS